MLLLDCMSEFAIGHVEDNIQPMHESTTFGG